MVAGPRWIAAVALVLVVPALVAQAPSDGLSLAGLEGTDDTPTVDRSIEVDITAVPCPAGYDNEALDDVCLAYDGQVPGPTWVFEEGQRVELTLNHSVGDSIDQLDVEPSLADRLNETRYTLHRHGVSVAACDDGVAQPRGTDICDSTVGPPGPGEHNGSITYTFQTDFPGYWHYHDHSLGLGAGTPHGEHAGPEAEHRGLFGSFLVLPEGVSVDEANVFDLHLLDPGPNGGLGLDETVQVGDRFDVITTGLGDRPWHVEMTAPDGSTVRALDLGPGVSRGISVEDAQQGTYRWTAQTALDPGTVYEGSIEVVQP